jgi:hypothetical protein
MASTNALDISLTKHIKSGGSCESGSCPNELPKIRCITVARFHGNFTDLDL